VAIAAGWKHSLALKNDGTVVAWGDNSLGQLDVPANLSNVVAIAAEGDGSFNLALVANSTPSGNNLTRTEAIGRDVVVTLSGTDPDGDALTFRVTFLPAAGALYQYATNGRGTPITSPNTSVNDSAGRLIYAPQTFALASPYDSFQFSANDQNADSPPATASINIVPAPLINNFQRNGNGSFQMDISGELTGTTYSLLGSSNLTNWIPLGPATQTIPGQFQFIDSSASSVPFRFYLLKSP
jgi:hypothetical protein